MLPGKGYRLPAPPPRSGEGLDLRCEGELSQAGHFEVRTSDPPARSAPSCRCAGCPGFPVTTLRRFEVHERHRAQVAVERDVLIGLAGYRGGKEPDLLDYPREWPRLRASDSLSAAAATSRRCWRLAASCDRGFGHCQVGGSLVQASPGKFAGGPRERDIRALGDGTAGSPQQRPIVWACPSSVRPNEWSASSRAASDQSPAAWVCRMASMISPCSLSHPAASRCRAGSCPGSLRRSSSRSRSAKRW